MDDELYISDKHGLYWSSTWIEDESGITIADGSYIYVAERYSDLFWVIASKLSQLNDYCFHQLVSSKEKLSALREEKTHLISQRHPYAEEFDYLDEAIPAWEENVFVTANAVPIVLLSSFVEWALKSVVKEFCGSVPRKPKSEISDVNFFLQYAKSNGGLNFKLDEETTCTLNSFRMIRNQFAHGNWQTLETLLGTLSLRDCFSAVTRLCQTLEESAWEGPWSV